MIRSSTTLAKVRALYERTHTREHARTGTIIEEWRLLQDKIVGSYRMRKLGKDLRETFVLGPLTFEQGVRGGVYWQQTRNGLTFTYTGFHAQRDAISDRVWEMHESARYLRLIGESVSLNAYVVEINPPNGRHEWRFIDKTSGNVIRIERIQKHRRYVTTYDDYRTFDGIPVPSHVRTTDSYGNVRDQTLLSRTLDLTPDPKDVEIPANRRTLVEFPAGSSFVRLPVRIANGLLVLRVAIGARSYDFLLDSGAAGIVVDPSVIDEARLERYGTRIGATIGTYSETTSIVPQMDVGQLKLHSVVVRVLTIPFTVDDHTHIAGLLGFDFFADTVVHVDLERGIVDAIAPASFKPAPDAIAVPLALDDKTPDVRAKIGGVYGRIVIDTGANRSVFTTAFASNAEFSTAGGGNTRFRGVGGTGAAESVHVREFELGGVPTADALVDVSSADFDAEDVDGTVGTDLIRGYNLFFDYRGAMLYIRKSRGLT